MLPPLSRADTSLLGRWWWTVDRWTLVAVGVLIGFGFGFVFRLWLGFPDDIGLCILDCFSSSASSGAGVIHLSDW